MSLFEDHPTPWTTRTVPNGDDDEPGTMIATIRDANGRPVLAAHPESFTMLVGVPEAFEFILNAANNAEKTPNRADSPESDPESGK
jgi:hypothetical protein